MSQQKKCNIRALAAKSLERIAVDGWSLHDALSAEDTVLTARDQALLREIVYGVCRYYWQLDFFMAQLLSKPLKPNETLVKHLIYIGIYQLMFCRLPAYAAVAETVAASQMLQKAWATKFINAVLRQFQRQQEVLQAAVSQHPVAYYSHPEWLITSIQQAWPEEYQTILQANNQQAPLTLRVNRQQFTLAAYLEQLQQQGISATAHRDVPYGICLDQPLSVGELPQFWEGACSIQDGASQLVEALLDLQPQQRVLDACAAPGGKTTLLLEAQPGLHVVAIEHNLKRLSKIQENLKRLKLSANIKHGDCLNPQAWWDQQLFDRILLDAPCSATGVIRRHPDIKLLRRKSDIALLAATQLAMLQALWPLLNVGGRLLYTTCSILPEENEAVIAAFLQEQTDAREVVISLPGAKSRTLGIQILPGEANMDGFYYALLERH